MCLVQLVKSESTLNKYIIEYIQHPYAVTIVFAKHCLKKLIISMLKPFLPLNTRRVYQKSLGVGIL